MTKTHARRPKTPQGRPTAPVHEDRAFRARPIAPIAPREHRPPPVSTGQLLRATLLVAVGLAVFGQPHFDAARADSPPIAFVAPVSE